MLKKLNLFLLLLVTAVAFTACGDSKEDDPAANTDVSPGLTLASGVGIVSGDVTYTLGASGNAPATLEFRLNGSKNSETTKKLNRVELIVNANNSGNALAETITMNNSTAPDDDGFTNLAISRPVPTLPGTYVYTFRLIDEDNQRAEVSVTVTIQAGSNCPTITIGSVTESNGVVTVGAPSGGTAPYSYSYSYTTSATEPVSANTFTARKTGVLYITVSDANGCTASTQYTVVGRAFDTNNTVTLGAQSATTGSFYDMESNTVVSLANYETNKGSIDLSYFYGTSNLATLASPNATAVAEVFSVNTANAGSVTFIEVPSGTYSDVTNYDALDEIFAAGTLKTVLATGGGNGGNGVNSLTVGDELVIYNGSRYALVKVTAISATSASGSITFTIKTFLCSGC